MNLDAAIRLIKRVTLKDDPWTGADISEDAIAAILNAVVAGEMTPADDKDATIARLKEDIATEKRRGDRWMEDAEALKAKLAEVTQSRDFWRDGWHNLSADKGTFEQGVEAAREKVVALRKAARGVVLAYQEANPMRTADMHPDSCGCLRCETDRLDHTLTTLAGEQP